jgi:hypothetical protein
MRETRAGEARVPKSQRNEIRHCLEVRNRDVGGSRAGRVEFPEIG